MRDDKGRGRSPALNSSAQLAFSIIFLFLGETQLPKYKAEAAVVALNEISRSRLSPNEEAAKPVVNSRSGYVCCSSCTCGTFFVEDSHLGNAWHGYCFSMSSNISGQFDGSLTAEPYVRGVCFCFH